MYIPYNTIHTI